MIQGYYYLHENKELIYKNSPDAIVDIRDNDLCHSAWAWDGERPTAWQILVEALSLDAEKGRIKELAEKWNCNDKDAKNYADYLGLQLDIDGNTMTARRPEDFETYPESPCGFGDTYLDAMADLCKQMGFVGGKMWNVTFIDLVRGQKKEKD